MQHLYTTDTNAGSKRSQVPRIDRTNRLRPLRTALWEVRAEWKDIGIELGISMATILVSQLC